MIQTTLGHIQLNVDSKNLPFYKELFSFLVLARLVIAETFIVELIDINFLEGAPCQDRKGEERHGYVQAVCPAGLG